MTRRLKASKSGISATDMKHLLDGVPSSYPQAACLWVLDPQASRLWVRRNHAAWLPHGHHFFLGGGGGERRRRSSSSWRSSSSRAACSAAAWAASSALRFLRFTYQRCSMNWTTTPNTANAAKPQFQSGALLTTMGIASAFPTLSISHRLEYVRKSVPAILETLVIQNRNKTTLNNPPTRKHKSGSSTPGARARAAR